MTAMSLDDLFLHELRDTHEAETMILLTVANLAKIDGAQAATLDGYAAQARERILKLAQIGNVESATHAAKPSILGMIAKIDEYITSIGNCELLAAAVNSEFLAARHYLLARYAMLSECARQLQRCEWAEFADRARASLSQTTSAPSDSQQADQYKGFSMGERLTAMFDRKR